MPKISSQQALLKVAASMERVAEALEKEAKEQGEMRQRAQLSYGTVGGGASRGEADALTKFIMNY